MFSLALIFICFAQCAHFADDITKQDFMARKAWPFPDLNNNPSRAVDSSLNLARSSWSDIHTSSNNHHEALGNPLSQYKKQSIWSGVEAHSSESLLNPFSLTLLNIIQIDDFSKLSLFMSFHNLPANFKLEGISLLKRALLSKKWGIVNFLINSNATIDKSDIIEMLKEENGNLFTFAIKNKIIGLAEILLKAGVNPWLEPDFFVEDLLKCTRLDIVEKVLSFPCENPEWKFRKFFPINIPNISLALQTFLKTKSDDSDNVEAFKCFELLCRYGPIPRDLIPQMIAHLPIDILMRYFSNGVRLNMWSAGVSVLSYLSTLPLNEENFEKLHLILSLYSDSRFTTKSLFNRLIFRSDSHLSSTYKDFRVEFLDNLYLKMRYLGVLFEYCPLDQLCKILSKAIKSRPNLNFILVLELFEKWANGLSERPEELQKLVDWCGTSLRNKVTTLLHDIRNKVDSTMDPQLASTIDQIIRKHNLSKSSKPYLGLIK